MIILLKIGLNSGTERESEKIQQMYNLDENQTALKILVADTYDTSDDAIDNLNL